MASTIAEIDFLQPLLGEFIEDGRQVNVLYGIPLPSSQVERLASIAQQLGPGTISVLIDDAAQVDHLCRFFQKAGIAVGVYLKVDTGYHRAGLPPSGLNKDDLVTKLVALDEEGKINFVGLYSHSSLSYNDFTSKQAMANLEDEINGCLEALNKITTLFSKPKEITISVGASPQVTSIENLVGKDETLSDDAEHLRQTMEKVILERPDGFRTRLELHAGVYSILDVQQLSTHSRVHLGEYEDEIAISVMAEVCSIYNNGEREQPEALVAVGVLGLGREPCAAYDGWGIIDREVSASDELRTRRRLVVKRISQEHCIIAWERSSDEKDLGALPPIPLQVGQSIRIYPNHACITGALYGWYYVVDSSVDGHKVTDIWVRAGGW